MESTEGKAVCFDWDDLCCVSKYPSVLLFWCGQGSWIAPDIGAGTCRTSLCMYAAYSTGLINSKERCLRARMYTETCEGVPKAQQRVLVSTENHVDGFREWKSHLKFKKYLIDTLFSLSAFSNPSFILVLFFNGNCRELNPDSSWENVWIDWQGYSQVFLGKGIHTAILN